MAPWATLTFARGVTVIAKEGASIVSLAPIYIEGTKELPVKFKSSQSTKFWEGISVRNTSLVITHAVIHDALVGVKIRSSVAAIENLFLENVISAIYVRHSKVEIRNIEVRPVEHAPSTYNLNVLKFSISEVVLENSLIRTSKTAAKIDTIDMGYSKNSRFVNNIKLANI